MAGTSSAAQRESYVLGAGLASAQSRTETVLIYIGKGELWRGSLVACAIVLIAAGAAVPHLPAEFLTALLCAAGAGLALAASCHAAPHSVLDFADVKSASVRRPSMAGAVPAITPAHDIPELLVRIPGTGADLAAWATLTTRMSHELRTPLNAVLGFSELMSNEVFGPLGSSQYSAYALDIHASGRQLLKSAEDALAITHLLTAPELKSGTAVASPAAAAADALAFHARELKARAVKIELEIAEDIEIVIDSQTLRQILSNLVAEALVRAETGATLHLGLSERRNGLELRLGLSASASRGQNGDDSFAILLARTLTELSGSRLQICETQDHQWHAAAKFQRASQADFFRHRGWTGTRGS